MRVTQHITSLRKTPQATVQLRPLAFGLWAIATGSTSLTKTWSVDRRLEQKPEIKRHYATKMCEVFFS